MVSAPFFSLHFVFVVNYGHDCSRCIYTYMLTCVYICLFDLCVTFTGEGGWEEFQAQGVFEGNFLDVYTVWAKHFPLRRRSMVL